MLVVGAALVLAAGAAWWVAAAPEPAAPLVEPTPLVVAPERVAPEQVQGGLESILPEFENTLHRHVGTLGPDEQYVMRVAAEKDGAYRMEYVCLGEGELLVRIKGTTQGEMLYQVDCGGNIGQYPFIAASPNLVIEVTRRGLESAAVGVQVIDID